MDDADGEIYVLDPQTGAAEIYAMADLSQTTLSLPAGWIFPQITDGKLRLFCPQSGTPVYAVIEEAGR